MAGRRGTHRSVCDTNTFCIHPSQRLPHIAPCLLSNGSRHGKRLTRRIWQLILLLPMILTAVAAQSDPRVVTTPHLGAELVSETATVEAGRPFWVALRFTLQPGWHIYWKNPGDSGEAPHIR